MKFTYETDRLILKVLDGNHASDVLRFYLANGNCLNAPKQSARTTSIQKLFSAVF